MPSKEVILKALKDIQLIQAEAVKLPQYIIALFLFLK
jgi:hypothetical protein